MLALLLAAAIATTSPATQGTSQPTSAPAALPTTKPAATRPATKPAIRPATKPTLPLSIAQAPTPSGPELWELIAQRKNRELRQSTLDRVAAMIAGNTPAEQTRALSTLVQTNEIRYDRSRFTSLIRKALGSPEFTVRAAALRALPSCGISQEDLQPIAQLARDPSPAVRSAVPATLVAANARVGSAELDGALLILLADENGGVRETALRSINDIDVSPVVEAKILSLWDDPKVNRDATMQALTSRPTIQGDIARKLIALLDGGDARYVSRASAALKNAVVEGDDRAKLDTALLRTLDDSLDGNVRDNCIVALSKSPDRAVWARLASIAEDPDESDRIRDVATRVLRQ